MWSKKAGPELQDFLDSVHSSEKRGTIGFLVQLNRKVKDRVGYTTRLDPGVQTCEQTLTKGTGSCRDSAWLLVQILRHLGIAARFVSGYLIQLASNETESDLRLGGSSRLGGGLFARCGMDRHGFDVGSFCRRGSHSAGLHAERSEGRSNRRHG